MHLYIIRHAEAIAQGEMGITEDAERPLTPRGIEQAHTLASALQKHGIQLDIILTSPLVRARQTAEQMIQAWTAPAPEVVVSNHLVPGGRRRKLAGELADLGLEHMAVVGHEPDLGRLTAWLIGSKKAQIKIAKAGVALVRFDEHIDKRLGFLEWLASPKWYPT